MTEEELESNFIFSDEEDLHTAGKSCECVPRFGKDGGRPGWIHNPIQSEVANGMRMSKAMGEGKPCRHGFQSCRLCHSTEDVANGAGGQKNDKGKLRWDLLPLAATQEIVAVLTFGADKYGADNWRKVQNAKSRYVAAAFRHLVSYALGEKYDDESGFHHLAHAACSLMFLIEGSA